MFGDAAFSGFSVSNLAAAKSFYGDQLGLPVQELPGMGLKLKFSNGHTIFIYEKADHQPATYTVLNFPVDAIDTAVDALGAKGIVFEKYEGMHQDEKGIARGIAVNMGPDIAWFKDPSSNILAVLQQPAA